MNQETAWFLAIAAIAILFSMLMISMQEPCVDVRDPRAQSGQHRVCEPRQISPGYQE
jgi:hypothetical protein